MTVFPTNSAEWAQQKAAIVARINELHVVLEHADSWEAARLVQGEILGLRWLLGQAEPARKPVSTPAHYV